MLACAEYKVSANLDFTQFLVWKKLAAKAIVRKCTVFHSIRPYGQIR
jgi:hypothetical protein